MDLEAYMNIPDLEKLAQANGIDIPRVRGYRLMVEEPKISEETIQEVNKQVEITVVKRLCEAVPFWSSHPDYRISCLQSDIYKDFYLVSEKTENGWIDYTDIRWDRIHGKKRKILKFEIKKMKRKVRQQYDTWNKYAGREDTLYIHSRMGGNNWKQYEYKKDITEQPWFLERIDDFFDNTYCDFYAQISTNECLSDMKVR